MDLSVGLVFLAVFLVTYYVFASPKNLPPGPLRLPFVGSMFFFQKFKTKHRHVVFHQAAKKYGSVMTIQIGNTLSVVLDGFDVIHEAFVKKADIFSDRPNAVSPFKKALEDIPGQGVIIHPYGNSWRMLRRFTLQALRDFGVGKTSIEEKIFTEVDAITKCLDESKEKPVLMNHLMQSAVGNVIFGIIFGKRYDYDDQEFEKIRQFTNKFVSGRGETSVTSFLPRSIARLISQKDVDALDRRVQSVVSIKNNVLQQIDEHEATFDPDNIRDFVDIYIQTCKDSDKENITKGSMFRVILDLFIAGLETTSTTLDWTFLYMIEFPEVQRKCQKEIDEVMGQKPIVYADLAKLPYVAATVQEVQRFSNVAPLGVSHCAMKDTTLKGYNIPAGTMVLANLYSANIDPKHWDNPEQFNPSKFIDKSGKCVKREANIPFSTGPRICLGEPLAKMELFVVIANLLQRFTFMRETDSVKNSLEPKLNQITNCPKPYKVRVSRRS